MAENNHAKQVFETMVSMFDDNDLKYDKDEEKLLIRSGMAGDDLPIPFILVVNEKQPVVQFLSPLTFEMPEDKRFDAAIAVCVANSGLCDGSFDYDIGSGSIVFRLTTSYLESTLSKDLFGYMLAVAVSTIDRYNDRFQALAEGKIDVHEFMKMEN